MTIDRLLPHAPHLENNPSVPSAAPSPCIRLQKIKTVAQVALMIFCATVAIGATALALSGSCVPLMVTVAATHAAALIAFATIELLMAYRDRFSDTFKNRILSIHAVMCDLLLILPISILLMTPLNSLEPQALKKCPSKRTPILLLHGFLGTAGTLIYPLCRLRKFFPVFAITHGGPFQSIDDSVARVREKVEEIRKITGSNELILLGHSMGGLVALRYRQKQAASQGIRVSHIVTLGTPLDGTTSARLASWASKEASEMKRGSPFLTEVREQWRTDETTQYLHIGSTHDSLVRPPSSTVEGCAPHTEVHQLEGMSHLEYILSDEVGDIVEEYLLRKKTTQENRR